MIFQVCASFVTHHRRMKISHLSAFIQHQSRPTSTTQQRQQALLLFGRTHRLPRSHHYHHHWRQLSVFSSGKDDHEHTDEQTTTSTHAQHALQPLTTFSGKEVPLGPGFSVRRILPVAKQRSVGAFIFLDHFGGVENVDSTDKDSATMNVGPHPHIGLMTLTYLYQGMILHRDSTGAQQVILPNQVNLMVAGRGVTHSERGRPSDIQAHWAEKKKEQPTPISSSMHGLQLWLALSKQEEDVGPSFHHGPAVPMTTNSNDTGIQATLVVGSCNGFRQRSIPLDSHLGRVFFVDVELTQERSSFVLQDMGSLGKNDTDPLHVTSEMEVGFYVSSGQVEVTLLRKENDPQENSPTGTVIRAGCMAVWKLEKSTSLQLKAEQSDSRVAVLGGTPLPEKRHLFWNFCSHSRSKVQRAAQAWQEMDRSVFPKVVGESNEDSIPLPTKPSR